MGYNLGDVLKVHQPAVPAAAAPALQELAIIPAAPADGAPLVTAVPVFPIKMQDAPGSVVRQVQW